MERVNLAPIFLAAPTSPDERCEAIAAHSKGFIYAISRTGITGKQQNVAADAALVALRSSAFGRWSKLPVAVGFGISNADHVAQVAKFADAAVIGSAIVELIERSTEEQAPGAVARFIEGLRQPSRCRPFNSEGREASSRSTNPCRRSPVASKEGHRSLA
jgi:tryptophan synthase alpha chain